MVAPRVKVAAVSTHKPGLLFLGQNLVDIFNHDWVKRRHFLVDLWRFHDVCARGYRATSSSNDGF